MHCAAGGHLWLPIVYGHPSRFMLEARDRGEILLGGCVLWDEAPLEGCARCGAER